jgi:hypothetical protein
MPRSRFDAQVEALTTEMASQATAVAAGGPWRGKIAGPSLGGLSAQKAEQYLRPLLDPRNHTPHATQLDAVTFHQYACCDNATDVGLEVIFPNTAAQLTGFRYLQKIRDALRPQAKLHLTESGILCNAPKGCSGNNYSCYYKTADFTRTYWVASAAQWLYQFLLTTRSADLATVAQSQILGYPKGFDGLSGEWPCGSMVDWESNRLNHKYWVQIALLQSLSRPFSFCETTYDSNSNAVFAQGVTSPKGERGDPSLHAVHVGCDLLMSRLLLSRN